MERYYHVGIVVPDLEAAQAYYTDLLGLEWGPVIETDIEVRLGDGSEQVFPNKIVYSTGEPHLELIQETPGSPWVSALLELREFISTGRQTLSTATWTPKGSLKP